MLDDLREQQVVPRDAEQAEPDDEQAGHRPGLERHVERRLEAIPRGLGDPRVRADRDVHADEARGRAEDGADDEAEAGAPAELVVEPEEQEGHDRDGRDRHVLALQVGGRSLLHGA